MKPSDSIRALPSAPSLIGGAEFSEIKNIVSKLYADKAEQAAFEGRWGILMERYAAWEKTFAGLHTSTTNRKLHLYQMMLGVFAGIALRTSAELLDVILSTVPKVGEELPTPGSGPTKVVRREITDRLGILLTLRTHEGNLISREIFD